MKRYHPLTPTLKETLQLHRQGLNTTQIANTRSLSLGTIEQHITDLVKWNKIDVNELVDLPTQTLIIPLLFTKASLTEVKESLDGIDWFTIKCVRAAVTGKLTRQNIK